MYFTPDKHPQLQSALETWDGTPFAQGVAVLGVGVDCVRFVCEVYAACGVDISPVGEIPRYSLAWGTIHEDSRVLSWLLGDAQARRRLQPVDPEEPWLPGDLLGITRHRSCNHLGIVGPGNPQQIWHVAIPAGVVHEDEVNFRRSGCVRAVFRLKK